MFKRVHSSTLLVVSLVVAMLVVPAVAVAAPGLHLTMTASPSTITVAGPVTYTYVLTYGGPSSEVTSVVLVDKFGTVSGPSYGDTSTASLAATDTWVYTRTVTTTATTTNVATATAGQMYENESSPVTATASVTVTYSPTTTTTTSTVNGGHIPDTGSPWYNLLAVGVALMLAGVVGIVVVSRRRHA